MRRPYLRELWKHQQIGHGMVSLAFQTTNAYVDGFVTAPTFSQDQKDCGLAFRGQPISERAKRDGGDSLSFRFMLIPHPLANEPVGNPR